MTKAKELSQQEIARLVAAAKGGDKEAFGRLVEAYQDRIYGYLARMLADPEEAEDVAQEVFLRIYKFIRKYRGNASLESWIYKIVLNYCRTHARRRSVWNRIFGLQSSMRSEDDRGYEVLDTLPSETYDPAKTIEQRSLAENILEAVHSLPDIYRDILVMREVNELSYEEIAQILGISIGTVKSRISRARDLVRGKVKL